MDSRNSLSSFCCRSSSGGAAPRRAPHSSTGDFSGLKITVVSFVVNGSSDTVAVGFTGVDFVSLMLAGLECVFSEVVNDPVVVVVDVFGFWILIALLLVPALGTHDGAWTLSWFAGRLWETGRREARDWQSSCVFI